MHLTMLQDLILDNIYPLFTRFLDCKVRRPALESNKFKAIRRPKNFSGELAPALHDLV
jgi:hypothetical protein